MRIRLWRRSPKVSFLFIPFIISFATVPTSAIVIKPPILSTSLTPSISSVLSDLSDLFQDLHQSAGHTPQFTQACWLYYFDKKEIHSTVESLRAFGINRVFLGGGNLWVNDAIQSGRLREFVSLCNSQGIVVDIMVLEDPNLALREYHTLALRLIREVLDFCRLNPATAFRGIHIDVEPHAIFRWEPEDWQYNNSVMVQYFELVDKIRAEIDNSGLRLEFTAAVGWWYNEYAEAGKLPLGATSHFIGRLDAVVPMVYDDYSPPLGVGSSASDALSRTLDEIQVMPTIIGLGAKKLPGCCNLVTTICEIKSARREEPNITGVCIFDYDVLVSGAK